MPAILFIECFIFSQCRQIICKIEISVISLKSTFYLESNYYLFSLSSAWIFYYELLKSVLQLNGNQERSAQFGAAKQVPIQDPDFAECVWTTKFPRLRLRPDNLCSHNMYGTVLRWIVWTGLKRLRVLESSHSEKLRVLLRQWSLFYLRANLWVAYRKWGGAVSHGVIRRDVMLGCQKVLHWGGGKFAKSMCYVLNGRYLKSWNNLQCTFAIAAQWQINKYYSYLLFNELTEFV